MIGQGGLFRSPTFHVLFIDQLNEPSVSATIATCRAVAATYSSSGSGATGGAQCAVTQLPRPGSKHKSSDSSQSSTARTLLAGAALLAATYLTTTTPTSDNQRPSCKSAPKRDGFPIISKAEVAKHKSEQVGGIWVTYDGGVYDITEFIASHPGGASRITMAAGGALEPFWKLYALHKKDEV